MAHIVRSIENVNESVVNQDLDNYTSANTNGTEFLYINRNLTYEHDINHDLINNCRYYMEGIALTPISIIGMIGKFSIDYFYQ